MAKDLEMMSLCEYRNNAMQVLRDYAGYIPARIYDNAFVIITMAQDESTITRALRACREAL